MSFFFGTMKTTFLTFTLLYLLNIDTRSSLKAFETNLICYIPMPKKALSNNKLAVIVCNAFISARYFFLQDKKVQRIHSISSMCKHASYDAQLFDERISHFIVIVELTGLCMCVRVWRFRFDMMWFIWLWPRSKAFNLYTKHKL